MGVHLLTSFSLPFITYAVLRKMDGSSLTDTCGPSTNPVPSDTSPDGHTPYDSDRKSQRWPTCTQEPSQSMPLLHRREAQVGTLGLQPTARVKVQTSGPTVIISWQPMCGPYPIPLEDLTLPKDVVQALPVTCSMAVYFSSMNAV